MLVDRLLNQSADENENGAGKCGNDGTDQIFSDKESIRLAVGIHIRFDSGIHVGSMSARTGFMAHDCVQEFHTVKKFKRSCSEQTV